jgi:hypothetical protein
MEGSKHDDLRRQLEAYEAEEVIGSNPMRSTKTPQTLTGLGPADSSPVESNWSPTPIRACGF